MVIDLETNISKWKGHKSCKIKTFDKSHIKKPSVDVRVRQGIGEDHRQVRPPVSPSVK